MPAWQRASAIVGGLLLVSICAVQLVLGSMYAGRFYPGVKVAGQNIGGLTRVEARDLLEKRAEDYKLTLVVGKKKYTATQDDLGLKYDINATLDEAYLQGRDQWLVPLGILEVSKSAESSYSFTADEAVQKKFIEKIVTETGQPAVDATVVVENGEPKVQPDQNGVGLSRGQIEEAMVSQIASVSTDPVELKMTSQPARIKAADVAPAIAETKTLLSVPVTVTHQGKVFKPTAADMGNWFTYEKSAPDEPAGLKTKISLDGIKNYLQKVAVQINVNPVNKKIRIENGTTSVEREGVEGLSLNQDQLADQIAKAVTEKKSFSGEAPTTKLGFKTETNRVVTLAYGKYIEVNIAKQRLWVYQDQKVIYETPITSGAAGKGRPTVQGLFSIQAKQTNRNLNGYAIGYDYNVFVNYWMPFYGNFGLHDASWRSAFGGPDYYYGGSSGCVNMPHAAAAFLYGWAEVGTPVWVHS